jgi:septal ring factor EnvC (AmiA/AmiB activator)
MSKEDLRATLERLRSEVDGLAFRNPRDRERMNALISGIERQLKNSRDDDEREELLDQIPDAIKQLEVEHPTVTAILSRVITALSSMGI